MRRMRPYHPTVLIPVSTPDGRYAYGNIQTTARDCAAATAVQMYGGILAQINRRTRSIGADTSDLDYLTQSKCSCPISEIGLL